MTQWFYNRLRFLRCVVRHSPADILCDILSQWHTPGPSVWCTLVCCLSWAHLRYIILYQVTTPSRCYLTSDKSEYMWLAPLLLSPSIDICDSIQVRPTNSIYCFSRVRLATVSFSQHFHPIGFCSFPIRTYFLTKLLVYIITRHVLCNIGWKWCTRRFRSCNGKDMSAWWPLVRHLAKSVIQAFKIVITPVFIYSFWFINCSSIATFLYWVLAK